MGIALLTELEAIPDLRSNAEKLIGVLRLRTAFAARSRYFAQDDTFITSLYNPSIRKFDNCQFC